MNAKNIIGWFMLAVGVMVLFFVASTFDEFRQQITFLLLFIGIISYIGLMLMLIANED